MNQEEGGRAEGDPMSKNIAGNMGRQCYNS